MNNYTFFIERLYSNDDKDIKLSSMPFNITVIENDCFLQMIRDISFSFLSREDNSCILRLIGIRNDGRKLVKIVSNLIDFLKFNDNRIPNNQTEVILIKQFSINLKSDNQENAAIYNDHQIKCTLWKHIMKDDKFYFSNPQIKLDYNTLTQMVNNFVR